jgi:hypothetical protein
MRDAQLPPAKTLDEFDFAKAPQIPGGENPRARRGRLH